MRRYFGTPIIHLNRHRTSPDIISRFARASLPATLTVYSAAYIPVKQTPLGTGQIGLGNRSGPDLVGRKFGRSLPQRPQIALTQCTNRQRHRLGRVAVVFSQHKSIPSRILSHNTTRQCATVPRSSDVCVLSCQTVGDSQSLVLIASKILFSLSSSTFNNRSYLIESDLPTRLRQPTIYFPPLCVSVCAYWRPSNPHTLPQKAHTLRKTSILLYDNCYVFFGYGLVCSH